MMKIHSKKGFTLAELLIVVAIIAVLVAIMIPVFTSQLSKAKHEVDVANVHSKFAELTATAMLDDGFTGKVTINASELESVMTATDKKVDGSTPGRLAITSNGIITTIDIDSDITITPTTP